MATAMIICKNGLDTLTSENISEVAEPEFQTSEEISELQLDDELPEDTVRPDAETSDLIAAVIRVADEFRPCHTKLDIIIGKHRAEVVELKRKFGVHQGSRGHRLLIPKDSEAIPLYWDDFVKFYFGVTSRRLNQLLEVRDDPEFGITRFKKPDVEKPLYKKGFEAGKKVNQQPTDTINWTDNAYIKACVEFVSSRLQPLEPDQKRFAIVATAIAQEILSKVGEAGNNAELTNAEPKLEAVPSQ